VGRLLHKLGPLHVGITSLAFTQMLATVIAQTIASIILFAIGCIPVVGQIIMAIVGLIDAVIWAICGFLSEEQTEEGAGGYICKGISGLVAKFIGWLIYSQTILVDFEAADRLDIFNVDQRFVDPLRGMATDNSLAYSAAMTNTITMVPVPIDWKAQIFSHQYNIDGRRVQVVHLRLCLCTGGAGSGRRQAAQHRGPGPQPDEGCMDPDGRQDPPDDRHGLYQRRAAARVGAGSIPEPLPGRGVRRARPGVLGHTGWPHMGPRLLHSHL